jgi:hypothetical protein
VDRHGLCFSKSTEESCGREAAAGIEWSGMHLTGLALLFWTVGLAGHLLLLLVLFVRRRAGQFPLFTTLIAMNVVRTAILWEVERHAGKVAYFYTYWTLGTIDMALQLGVVYELATHVFRPLGRWAPDVRQSVLWLVSGSVAVAALLTVIPQPETRFWVRALVIRGNFFSSVLMSELFLGMIVLAVTVHLPWKTHVARIAQALGTYSVICILTEAGHSTFGTGSKIFSTLSQIRMIVYLLCLGYWIVMLWRDAPAPLELPEEMRRQLYLLQRRVEYDLQRLRALKR